jgi:multiple sugar transport system ATP-binding protein
MNLLKGRVKGNAIAMDGVELPYSGRRDVSEGQEVLYGVRPEHLQLSDAGLPARISVVEPTGSETTVVLRFGETELVALFRERHDFKPGDTLKLRPRPDLVHLFHAETGKRL